ncbi:hypothetical protein EMCRGX_G004742 [Ephydatia muelleri]
MISIAALFLVFLADVRAMPGGAPPSACASISPQPGHGGSSQLVANSPYSLNVSQLTAARGYIPGSTYTLVLTGGAMQYKGLLVQGRSGSNPVGSFAAGAQVQPACASNTAVTHIDRSVKNNVQLTWTAPAAGTGSVVFSYAVVVQNDMNGNTYYATLTSPAIAELAVAVSSANSSASSISPTSSAVMVSSTSIPCNGHSSGHSSEYRRPSLPTKLHRLSDSIGAAGDIHRAQICGILTKSSLSSLQIAKSFLIH